MIALDTNILIYAHHSRYPEHRRARAAIERAAQNERGWGFAFPCIAEFWAVATCISRRPPGGRCKSFHAHSSNR